VPYEPRKLLLAAALQVPAAVLANVLLALYTGTPGNVWFAVLLFVANIGAFVYFLAPALVFRILATPLFRSRPRLPLWVLAVFGLSVAAVAAYFALSWSYGLRYQGDVITLGLAYLNAVTVVGLLIVAVRNRFNPTFLSSFVFTWWLVLWLSTYAFPYLGELP
jgi:hypothetical protein